MTNPNLEYVFLKMFRFTIAKPYDTIKYKIQDILNSCDNACVYQRNNSTAGLMINPMHLSNGRVIQSSMEFLEDWFDTLEYIENIAEEVFLLSEGGLDPIYIYNMPGLVPEERLTKTYYEYRKNQSIPHLLTCCSK